MTISKPSPANALHARAPSRRHVLATLLGGMAPGAHTTAQASDASTEPGECVAPSKPGGGFGLTCGLAADAIQAVRPGRAPLPTRFLPGGIGAVAFDQVATGRLGGPGTLVAFSSGSLLNIAQGRFGPHPVGAVRFIATLGTDYGVIAVHRDARYQSLAQVTAALQRDSARVVFGAGGTIGSQDWIKAAQLVRAAGQDHKKMRFVAFEGGGEALKALRGGHLDIFTGDAAEAMQAAAQGLPLRILAVLAPQRLQGQLAGLPTAREQGIDLTWPTVRGLYMAASTPDAAVRAWTNAFEQALAAPGYTALCSRYGLYPFALTGAALDNFVQRSLQDYRRMAQDLGLRTWPR
ncbi:Bug family tripartite tricarboxylate transporter substrate binding protein [Acidovorax sp.]|uniref:Bug family tripartite tricarboxylate transporter substrate binding protein n=1 Tax=Acidovorax sp. TaxID=1872122 RepID=UPI002ACE3602|nr:tripartite tricarboxylate transporter substrate-binding protein [Acidovorax sp.]MDZ7863464.1 tripartite tricarboxylate transporter substrate-binding protein [Acidovorax sp.]